MSSTLFADWEQEHAQRRAKEIRAEEIRNATVKALVDQAVRVAAEMPGGWGGEDPVDLVVTFAERKRGNR